MGKEPARGSRSVGRVLLLSLLMLLLVAPAASAERKTLPGDPPAVDVFESGGMEITTDGVRFLGT